VRRCKTCCKVEDSSAGALKKGIFDEEMSEPIREESEEEAIHWRVAVVLSQLAPKW